MSDPALASRVHVHRDSDMGEWSPQLLSTTAWRSCPARQHAGSSGRGHDHLAGASRQLRLKKAPPSAGHRETPLSRIDLKNMDTLAGAGAVILPLTPGFYHQPSTIDDIVDFMAARVLDQLGAEHDLPLRWDGTRNSSGLRAASESPKTQPSD